MMHNKLETKKYLIRPRRLVRSLQQDSQGGLYELCRYKESHIEEESRSPRSAAAVVQRSGTIRIAGESRHAEPGDIFILPALPAAEPTRTMDPWFLVAIFWVATVALRLFLIA
jgi:hypothetical protein